MNGTDIAFLAVGVVIVIVVGRLLAYSGRRYIRSAAGARQEGSGSAATLVSVVFHLIALGLLALISVLPAGGDDTQSFMLRIGVLLLVLGGVYGAAIAAVARRRQAEITEAAFTGRERPASLAAPQLSDPDPTAPREVPPEARRQPTDDEPPQQPQQPRRGPAPRPTRRQDGT